MNKYILLMAIFIATIVVGTLLVCHSIIDYQQQELRYKDETIHSLVKLNYVSDEELLAEANRLYKERGYSK